MQQNSSLILNELSSSLNNTEEKKANCITFFETSFDWKECRIEKFIQQKLDYIYLNPCKGNKIVELPEQYEHSSAKYYFTANKVLSCYKFYGIERFNETAYILLRRFCYHRICREGKTYNFVFCNHMQFIFKSVNFNYPIVRIEN
jgi:hypothetical protein